MSREAHGVVVAVPAHDEEPVLADCLASVRRAVAELPEALARRVLVVVAADSCRDATATLARRDGALVVELQRRAVGAARDAAIRAGLQHLDLEPASVWLACTDADSVVPSHWLASQLAQAGLGAELVVGTVEPADALDPALLAAWRANHQLREGHGYVHGANLGMWADAWQQLGGFGPLPLHEDTRLVERARAAGLVVHATDAHRVLTSARLDNRVPGGFAGYLRGLRDDLAG